MDFNPAVFSELLDADFSRCASTWHVDHFRIGALKASILKKYVCGTNDILHKEAVADFAARNAEAGLFQLDESFVNGVLFRAWKNELARCLHSGPLQSSVLQFHAFTEHGGCGPGASIDTRTTSFLEKMFVSTLSCTSLDLYERYKHSIGAGRWAEAEKSRFSAFGIHLVPGSRLSSVLKDSTKNRTICIEPVLNMFMQKGCGRVLESVLKKCLNIDITNQADKNKALARTASIINGKATVDMKNASDSILLVLLKNLLDRQDYEAFLMLRSPYASVDGEWIELNMISTMGNGFTFPLMTLLFATLIRAVYLVEGLGRCNAGQGDYGVFGDDLIVDREAIPVLYAALRSAGFIVNESKSFTEGPFRESCGGDFYLGHDVRGVYFKELNDDVQKYSAFNRLHLWSIRHGINLNRSLAYLMGLAKFQPVPCHASVGEGYIITSDHLTSPKRNANGSTYYRSTERVVKGQLSADRFCVNSSFDGKIISFIGGYIRDNRVSCRYDTTCAVVKKITPSWDYIQHPGVNRRGLSLSWDQLLS